MREQVVIIGGGYAGVLAANRLASSDCGAQVLLVNERERFVERIRLHEYAAGTRKSAEVEFAGLLHPAVELVVDRVVDIDDAHGVLSLAPGRTIGYDYGIYAVGSVAAPAPSGQLSVATQDAAAQVRDRLDALADGVSVDVIGAGLTGIETASEIAQRYPQLQVRLRTDEPVGSSTGVQGSRRLHRSIERLGITVVEVSRDALIEDADLVVNCAGFVVPALASTSGLPVDADGRLLVAPDLRVLGSERLFGAGDAVRIDDPTGAHLRMSCAAAMPMGGQAATNIQLLLRGEPTAAHSNGFLAQCISLGRRDGHVQFMHRDDTPRGVALRGRAGGLTKEYICRQTITWLRGEAKRSGSYWWPHGPKPTAAERVSELVK